MFSSFQEGTGWRCCDREILFREAIEGYRRLSRTGRLPEDQRMELAGKADGNPRLLDEMLTYIQRQPKLFVERNRSGALSAKGLKVVLGVA